VDLDAFWIERTLVTVDAFATFVRATGFVTTAERRGTGKTAHPREGRNSGCSRLATASPARRISLITRRRAGCLTGKLNSGL